MQKQHRQAAPSSHLTTHQAQAKSNTSRSNSLAMQDAGVGPLAETYLGVNDGPRRRGEPDTWVQASTTAPPEGAVVVDLLAGELPDAGTQWVRTGEAQWIDIGSLSESDRAQVLRRIGGEGGAVEAQENGLKLSTTATEHSIEADTHTAGSVLRDANDREDWEDAGHWDFLNQGSEALNAADCSPEERATWKENQTKPGAWYNSYTIEDGEVQVHRSPFDTREGSEPEVDLDGLQDLISRSLDTNQISEVFGDDQQAFTEAMLASMDQTELGEEGATAVLDEVWSYLQTGSGSDGTTDIARLQGLIKAVSGDTQQTASSNTDFTGNGTFEVAPGVELPLGDGAFGRATMLSLMHVFGDAEENAIPPMTLGFVDADLFGEGDRFIDDKSGSISGNWGKVRDAVDQSQGWTNGVDGVMDREIASFSQSSSVVGKRAERKEKIQVAESLERAYQALYKEDNDTSRKAFAELFDLKPRDIFTDDGLDPLALMRAVGDGSPNSMGKGGESALKPMLHVLTHPEDLDPDDPIRQTIEKREDKTFEGPARLNGVIDEPEQAPEYLELIQALSDHYGIEIRMIGVPTGKMSDQPVDELSFTDLKEVKWNRRNNEVEFPTTQNGVTRVRDVATGKRNQGARIDFHDDQYVVD